MPSCSLSTEDTVFDVLIVGAGLSGIGAAFQLQTKCPDKRFVILEGRQTIGGTWDLFRYPGIRSDSDMYTLGYAFKPWKYPKAIADGPSILSYIREMAEDAGLIQNIRFGHKVISASWSSNEACWTVQVENGDALKTYRTRFLYMCSGYYSYDQAHRPHFEGESVYQGQIVQPQFWPQDLDYTGKTVVVIGSGATAVTIVPEMAKTAKHVTLLQRSPTYIVAMPSVDVFAQITSRIFPAGLAYSMVRWKNILIRILQFRFIRRFPGLVKRYLVKSAVKQIGGDGTGAHHFTPHYKPWDQRICVAPDGDLFRAIREGRASVVTDHIEHFTQSGVRLKSGKALQADIVVMATGLTLKMFGGAAITVDGNPLQANQAFAYKGMMLSGIPNCVMAFGYTNASWTLKSDLTAGYVCRLLRYMDRHGYQIAVPENEANMLSEPFLSFTSGYVQRGKDILPKQGPHAPWRVYQNYLQDLIMLRFGRLNDGVLRFSGKGSMP